MMLGYGRCQNFILSGGRIYTPIPTNREEQAKLWMTLLEWMRAELKAGMFSDWGSYCDAGSEYRRADGDEVSLQSHILKYQPFIIFSLKPVLSVDQTIESIKRAVAAAKGR